VPNIPQSKYELSPPFSFDVTQVTRENVIHNLVEISTPASRFAPVMILQKYAAFRITHVFLFNTSSENFGVKLKILIIDTGITYKKFYLHG